MHHSINTGPFVYCCTYQAPHQTVTYQNTGDGQSHQWLYVREGQAVGKFRATSDVSTAPIIVMGPDPAGTLVDMRSYNDTWVTTTTEEKGFAAILFNPIPATKELDVEIVQGPTTKSITPDARITMVCISGPVTANGNTVITQQYVKILPSHTVELILPEHTIVALVK